jgi:hypothetical protein
MKFTQVVQIAAKSSAVASLDWLVWRVAIIHDDTMSRGCRSADLPNLAINSINACISSLQELLTDSLRSCLNNAPNMQ